MLSRFLAEIEYVFTRTLESTTLKWKWFSNEHVSSQNVKLSFKPVTITVRCYTPYALLCLKVLAHLVFEKTDKVNGSGHILRAKANYLGLSGIKIACYLAVQATNKRIYL